MSAASLAKHMRPNENIIQGEPSLENNVRTQAIRSTEWTLRRNGLLVAANAQMQLWLFGTSQEYLNERLQACGHITESSFGIDGNPEFKFIRSGSVTASDILRDPIMAQKPGKAISGQPSISGVITPRLIPPPSEITKPKSSTPLLDDPQFSHNRMYLFFMAACMQSAVLQMSSTMSVIPLNFKTVAFRHAGVWSLCGLDVSLTNKGDILISTGIEEGAIVNLIADDDDAQSKTNLSSKIVRIAPAGRLGRVIVERGSDARSSAFNIKSNCHRSEQSATWRRAVKDVLEARNITLSRADANDGWCRVRLAEMTKDLLNRTNNTAKVLDDQGAFEWPKELCFGYIEHNSLHDTHFNHKESEQASLDNFGARLLGRYGVGTWRDPIDEVEALANLDFVRHDTDHHAMRDKGVSADSDFPGHEIMALEEDWTPPLFQYAPHQDMEKAALLYPTPPDGPNSANVVIDQNSSQRRDMVMLSPEVGGDLRELFEDPTLNVTEEDFDYFDRPTPHRDEIYVAPQTTVDSLDIPMDSVPTSSQPPIGASPLDITHNIPVPRHGFPEATSLIVPESGILNERSRQQNDFEDTSFHNKNTYMMRDTHKSDARNMAEPDGTTIVMDNKYGENGRFGKINANGVVTKTSKVPDMKASVSNPKALMRLNPAWKRFRSTTISPTASDSDSESSTPASPYEPYSATRNVVKRTKLVDEDQIIASTLAGTTSMRDALPSDTVREKANMYRSMFLNKLCRSSPGEWSLCSFPAPSGGLPSCSTSHTWTSENFIEIAQLANAQLVTSTSLLAREQARTVSQSKGLLNECAFMVKSAALRALGGEVVQQDVFANAALLSAERDNSGSKFQPKPVARRNVTDQVERSEAASTDSTVFSIPEPMLRVQRCEGESWQLLPSASAFWDLLDLAPAHGSKKVKALCLYPENEGLLKHVARFVDTITIAWHSGRLGIHDLLDDPDVGDSFVPVRLETCISLRSTIDSYRSACVELAKSLRLLIPKDDESIVIYIVNPFETENVLFDLCSCFHALISYISKDTADGHPSTWTGHDPPVLQIVPIRMILSTHGPLLPDPQHIALLCREVYGRCLGPLDNAHTGPTFSQAIELAEDPANEFNFRLTSRPPTNLLQDNSCLHIAYCRSFDDLWITAAWTDNTGSFQHQAPYYMGKGQSVATIAREIWQSSMEYIKTRKVHWRLFLASAAPMPLAERKIWRDLAIRTKLQTEGLIFNLALIATNASPTFQIYPKPANESFVSESATSKTAAAPISSLPFISTPSSTPANAPFSPFSTTTPTATAAQTPMSMPDATTPRTSFFPPMTNLYSTPNAPGTDTDASTRLIDLSDETCGIVLSRRLNVARGVIDYHPALSSGYLVKRTGVNDTDVPVILEVNIMAIDLVPAGTTPRLLESTLRSMPRIPPASAYGPARSTAQRTTLPHPTQDAPSPSGATHNAGDEAAKQAGRQKRYDIALREVLVMYRRLALLAKVRGLQDVNGTTPWHILVVMRVAEGLRKCAGVPDSWK